MRAFPLMFVLLSPFFLVDVRAVEGESEGFTKVKEIENLDKLVERTKRQLMRQLAVGKLPRQPETLEGVHKLLPAALERATKIGVPWPKEVYDPQKPAYGHKHVEGRSTYLFFSNTKGFAQGLCVVFPDSVLGSTGRIIVPLPK